MMQKNTGKTRSKLLEISVSDLVKIYTQTVDTKVQRDFEESFKKRESSSAFKKQYPRLFDDGGFYYLMPSRYGKCYAVNLDTGQHSMVSGNQMPVQNIPLAFAPDVSDQDMREAYFRAVGICASKKGDYYAPMHSDERFRLAESLKRRIPPNFESAFMLFDANTDGNDKDWLALLGNIYDTHLDNPTLFNPGKAEAFYREAAAQGSAVAAFNIATKYLAGNETEIKLDYALKWYYRASELGEKTASARIAGILDFQSILQDASNEGHHTNEALSLYQEGSDQGDIESMFVLAKVFMAGRDVSQDKNEAKKLYNKILKSKPRAHEELIYAYVAYITAARTFLGLDVAESDQLAISLLRMIPKNSNKREIKYTLNKLSKELIEKIEKSEQDPQNYKYAKALAKWMYEKPYRIHEVIEQISDGRIKTTQPVLNVVALMSGLAFAEEWGARYDWADLYAVVNAKRYGVSPSELIKSTLNTGPRYTSLDNRNMPLLGAYEAASKNESEIARQRRDTGSFVPEPGIVHVQGVSADSRGIYYDVIASPESPALILPEDIVVTQILAFGDRNGVIWPSLSLEDHDIDEKILEKRDAISTKVWGPEWLGHTEFGRTLFVTDHLIGTWAWNAEKFAVGDNKHSVSQAVQNVAHELIRSIKLTGGREGDGESARVMLKPENVYIKNNKDFSLSGFFNARVMQVKMRVDGSYILEKNGQENRLVSLNDTTYAQGRVCQKLTDRYDDIAMLDPRFERARQLMALLYATFRLRHMGYKPPYQIQKSLTEDLEEMRALGKVPKADRFNNRYSMMRPLQHNKPGYWL